MTDNELEVAPYPHPTKPRRQRAPPQERRKNKFVVVLSVGASCVLAAAATAATLAAGLERERVKLILERERLERERQRHKGNWWRSIVGTVVTVTVKIALSAVASSLSGGRVCNSRDGDCGRVILYNDNQVNFIGGNNQLMSS